MEWLISILTLLGLTVFISWPFFQKDVLFLSFSRSKLSSIRKSLREQKARDILALRELDFDFETGKLSKDDYKAIRETYETKAIKTLKALDSINEKWDEAYSQIQKVRS